MLIEELITLGSMFLKQQRIFSGGTKQLQFGGRFKSLSQAATEATYFFPVVASEQLASDEIIMVMRALERSYAIFTRTAFQLIPSIEVNNFTDTTIKDYISKFHTNIGIANHPRMSINLESAGFNTDINYGVLNEQNAMNDFLKNRVKFGNDNTIADHIPGTDGMGRDRAGNITSMNQINKGPILGDVDWRKANDLLPTVVNVPIKFISKDSGASNIVEVSVNIKATMHKASSNSLIQDIVKSMNQGRGFLNFVKYVSGEQRSLMDFLFGVSSMKEDLLNKKTSPWLDAFKRRKRLSNLAWGTMAEQFKPIGTICLTMNEVNTLKNQYDIDIFKEAENIMKQYYLLGFVILDQVNEIVHIQYDSQPGFQDYPYRTLEREGANQDRTVRDMVKAMGSFR